ncbi:hypothetical protein [Streptomyces sp. NBC_01481]|uniref:hypothetical protein n=1 Tax=Streptomyces sp. NBC_01481 TaxID=2975869 RepID=UPI0022531F32|nr:hypothetical protein [Streptomyces sp. NBC_01481]MCX4587465.1 hypothetical protein [Streptomyces sp. NBC_01481]
MAETQKPQCYTLAELPPEPSPVPGCADCLSIGVRKANARSGGDFSGASDANVALMTHLAEEHDG